MGYLSHFEITSEPEAPEALIAEMASVSGYSFYDQGGMVTPDGECKWYDYKDHMCIVSGRLPHLLIRVDREGEEQPDMSRCWFRGGKSTGEIKPEMVWPEPPLDTLPPAAPDPAEKARSLKASALSKLTPEERDALGV